MVNRQVFTGKLATKRTNPFTMKKIFLPLAVIATAVLLSCGHLKPSVEADKISGGIDLAAYTQLDSIHYKGTGYLKHVALRKNYALVNFVFEPGARNNWHTHSGAEQILYVTDGEGFYQQEDKRKQLIKKGDVVVIPPDTKHWNGATDKKRLVHISISDRVTLEHVKWFSAVTAEEYSH